MKSYPVEELVGSLQKQLQAKDEIIKELKEALIMSYSILTYYSNMHSGEFNAVAAREALDKIYTKCKQIEEMEKAK